MIVDFQIKIVNPIFFQKVRDFRVFPNQKVSVLKLITLYFIIIAID